MVYVKWVFWGTFWVLIAAFFHYTLPQRDIVRIVNTYEERQELGDWTRIFWSVPDDQSAALINRDVQFIQAVTPGGIHLWVFPHDADGGFNAGGRVADSILE